MRNFNNVTNIDIEKSLKNWLAQVTARLKKIAEKQDIVKN